MARALCILGAWLWLAFAGQAAQAWGDNLSLPAPAPVVDEFGLLQRGEAAELAGVLRAAKERSGVEISIFLPSSLRGREIEDFSIAVAEAWKLGRKKEDKGLLLIVAPKERKMRLEVGYGLEGQLPDAYARRILDDVMRPYFRAGRYYDGLLATLAAIHQRVPIGLGDDVAPRVSVEDARGAKPLPKGLVLTLLVVFFLFFVPFILLARLLQALGIVRRPRTYGGWHSGGWGGGSSWGGGGWGGGGGSSWGGGGGGFGGGGASSNW